MGNSNKPKSLFSIIFSIVGIIIAYRVLKWLIDNPGAIVIGFLLFLALIIVVIILAVKAAKKKEEEEKAKKQAETEPEVIKTADPAVGSEKEEALKKARRYVMEERIILAKMQNSEVKASSLRVVDLAEKILNTLREKPEKINQSSQFLNYYLPTLGVILQKYRKLEISGVDITGTPEKVLNYMSDIESALQKEYHNLFQNDFLDLSVEMEAMTIAFKRDGLLTDEDLAKAYEAQEIKLTV